MEKFKLPRVKQCAKCPWKTNVNPHDIPDGYCEVKHKGLYKTIAKNGVLKIGEPLNVMACHHSIGNDNMYCIGWLNNQLGIGNNIMLRLQMRHCSNIGDINVIGDQHTSFEDTLPKSLNKLI